MKDEGPEKTRYLVKSLKDLNIEDEIACKTPRRNVIIKILTLLHSNDFLYRQVHTNRSAAVQWVKVILHTIYKHHRFSNGILITVLGFQEIFIDKSSKICRLIPANMQMVNINRS